MRVLHVITSVSPVRGGPSQAVLEAVGSLRKRGIDAEIATTNDDGPNVLDVPLGRRIEWSGVPVRFFRRFSPRIGSLREFAFSLDFTLWLWRHVRDYDLLHVHALFSYPSSMAMLVARARKVPFICRPSGLLCRWSLQQSRGRKRLFLELFDRANLDASAAIEYTAEQERAESADVGLQAPAIVLPYGLHIPAEIPNARALLRQRLGLPTAEPIILFMSRLHVKKGLMILIDALESHTERGFTLVVAGSGAREYEEEVRARVEAGSLRERTHFVGFASGEFKRLLLQGSDLFVLPSFSESFAISVLEAIACCTPVLTTPGVPLASLIERFDLGWIAPPDPSSMAEALAGVFAATRDTGSEVARCERGRTLVAENFTWEIIAAHLAKLYEAILNGEPLPSFELSRIVRLSESSTFCGAAAGT
ncbi:MAG: glycosyltransferase [Chthoniobacteraceae bacterium]